MKNVAENTIKPRQEASPILVCEAKTEQETALFWEELYRYQERDLFPDMDEQDREYFSGQKYRGEIERLHDRGQDRCRYLFFEREGEKIGLAMPVLYETEDGKCFLLEFCVFLQFRGQGTGKRCGEAFLAWAEEQGAAYVELNYGGQERRFRFWQRLGFLPNGRDEWGEPLMLLPPRESCPVTVELLTDLQDWELLKLENGYLGEIGEEILSQERKERLKKAVADGEIVFFLARRSCRAVGMCSVSLCFSTFACGKVGIFEDFYVEPVFRKRGIAGRLARAAQEWCAGQGVASLTVCCAPCDEEMYSALGFTVRLGATYAFTR